MSEIMSLSGSWLAGTAFALGQC